MLKTLQTSKIPRIRSLEWGIHLRCRNGSFARNGLPDIVMLVVADERVYDAVRINRPDVCAVGYVHGLVGGDGEAFGVSKFGPYGRTFVPAVGLVSRNASISRTDRHLEIGKVR